MTAWHVERWEGDERSFRDWYDVHAAAAAHDLPDLPDDPWEEFRLAGVEHRDDALDEWLLARDRHGALVGGAALQLPLLDNTDVVELDLVVHPEARREGAGTALLQAARHRAREHGRTRLLVEIGAPLGETPPGAGFALANGGTSALGEVHRTLDLAGFDADAFTMAVPPGYELVTWAGTPDPGLLDDLAALRVRMSTDAPMGDLDWKPEHWDAGRVVALYERMHARGRLLVSAAVRHTATGRLVGWTDLGVSHHAPEHGFQWDLLVLREHRGARLGTVLKVENLRNLLGHSPRTRWVHTWNAASNVHMIAINEAVGFRVTGLWTDWLLPV